MSGASFNFNSPFERLGAAAELSGLKLPPGPKIDPDLNPPISFVRVEKVLKFSGLEIPAQVLLKCARPDSQNPAYEFNITLTATERELQAARSQLQPFPYLVKSGGQSVLSFQALLEVSRGGILNSIANYRGIGNAGGLPMQSLKDWLQSLNGRQWSAALINMGEPEPIIKPKTVAAPSASERCMREIEQKLNAARNIKKKRWHAYPFGA